MYLHIRWSSLQEITLLYRCSFSLKLVTSLEKPRKALRYVIVYLKTHINWLVMINEPKALKQIYRYHTCM